MNFRTSFLSFCSQWRDYGRNGTGFCIGFSPTLFLPDVGTVSPVATENIYVGSVRYGDADTERAHRKGIHEAARITNNVARSQHVVLSSEPLHIEYINAMAKIYIASQLIWRCLTSKRKKFKVEDEIRFVILGQAKNFTGLTRLLGKRTYVEHKLPLKKPGSVEEIIVGSNAPGSALRMVRELLDNAGYSGVRVMRSKIRL